MKNLLFVPVYNCEKQILRVFQRFNSENLANIDEVLLIDNCSQDRSFQEVLRIKTGFEKKMTVLQNSENIGFGGSHKRAFRYAQENGFDFCIVLHGDDQARFDNFTGVIKTLNPENDAFVFGSRFSLKSRTFNYSGLRIAGNLFFNALASLVCKEIIPDLGGSGLNVYHLKTLFSNCDLEVLPNDLTFHAKLLLHLTNKNCKIRFVPIEWHEADQVSNVKMFSQSMNLFRLIREQIKK
jgi:glycosyltransferase involved in cell wall biosynthesis